MPTTRVRVTEAADIVGAANVTGPVDLTDVSASAANPMPAATPSTEPTTPRKSAWSRTSPMTWARVVPAARSRPTSRVSSATVMDSVLKMRNAPANRTTAATSSSAPRKSAISERSESARSVVCASKYGWVLSWFCSSPVRTSTDVPGAVLRSTRVTSSDPNSVCAAGRVMITRRPFASGSVPSPATMPTIV